MSEIRKISTGIILSILWLLLAGQLVNAQSAIMITDPLGGTNQQGSMLKVNPATGVRTVHSDFGNPAQGPTGVSPQGAIYIGAGISGPNPHILVIDSLAGTNTLGALFKVNPNNGVRTILSDFGNPSQGPTGVNPQDVAITSGLAGLGRKFVVADNLAGTNSRGAIFAVDPTTGRRTLLSDFGNSSQGELGMNPVSITVSPGSLDLGLGERILVLDYEAGTDGRGALFEVNPNNGRRTRQSDFGRADKGPLGADPQTVDRVPAVLDLANTVLVIDSSGGTGFRGSLLRVTVGGGAQSGNRTLLSDFGNPLQGLVGLNPHGLKPVNGLLTLGTTLLVVDNFAGTNFGGVLFSINPNNGNRTVIADLGDTSKGPSLGNDPCHLAVVP